MIESCTENLCPEEDVCSTTPTSAKTENCKPLKPSCADTCDKIDVPDGVYTSVTITSGCITGAGQHEQPAYTPPLCCPSCGEPATGTGGTVTINPDVCNLASNSSGLLVKPVFSGGNVTVTGCGTAMSPYKLTAPATSGTTCVESGTDAVITVDTVDGCFQISHATTDVGVIDNSWITTDQYGHVTAFAAQTTALNVLAPVEIRTLGGVDFVTLTAGQAGTFSSPYGSMTFDSSGRLVTLTPAVPLITPGQFTTTDGKTVTYNQYGTIISVSV